MMSKNKKEEFVTFPPLTSYANEEEYLDDATAQPLQPPMDEEEWKQYYFPPAYSDQLDYSNKAEQVESGQSKSKVYKPKARAQPGKYKREHKLERAKGRDARAKAENNARIFKSLKHLESGIGGFRMAMENEAEVFYTPHDHRYKTRTYSRPSSIGKESKRDLVRKAFQRTEERRKILENNMLNFFTDFIFCGSHCRRRRSAWYRWAPI